MKINVTQIFTLRHFNKFKKTILKTDSLDYVNGEILSQYNDESVLHLMIFYNKNLTSIECNYQIYDKKSFVIIRYIKHQRSELKRINISIKIYINYKDFIYFTEERDLSRRQIKYLNMLFEYNIKIVYRSKSQNIKTNALTRIIKFKFINFQNERLRQ